MSYEERSYTQFFSLPLQRRGALAHLTDAARRGTEFFGIDRLHRVDDRERGTHLLDLPQNLGQIGLAQHQEVLRAHGQAIGPHFDLLERLFARGIEHALGSFAQ